MRRTGYMRPWELASNGGTRGGPAYMLMRLTIGSSADSIDVMARWKSYVARRERFN